jgi:hypothetical protein
MDFRERLLNKLTSNHAGLKTPLAIHLANIRTHRLERDLERSEQSRTVERAAVVDDVVG